MSQAEHEGSSVIFPAYGEAAVPHEPLPLHQEVLMSRAEIDSFISETAAEIIRNYDNPVFVCFRRGGELFSSRLMQQIVEMAPDYHPEIDEMTIRTYGDERESSQPSEIVTGLAPITLSRMDGRVVVCLDDLLDKGETISTAEPYLMENGASRVDLIVVGQKEKPRPAKWQDATIYGRVFQDVWLTGFGLDDAKLAPEGNRWLPYIARANPEELYEGR